jgi:hypothetical protein
MLNKTLQGSFIPSESKPLVGLKEIDRQTIWAYVNNLKPGLDVTLDVDTQIIETNKSEAQYCYGGYKAFQAMKVSWAETLLVLNDEFREGNVSPRKDINRIVDEAFDRLPNSYPNSHLADAGARSTRSSHFFSVFSGL